MPIGSVIVLTAIVFAFVGFAAVLAWCDITTGRAASRVQPVRDTPSGTGEPEAWKGA